MPVSHCVKPCRIARDYSLQHELFLSHTVGANNTRERSTDEQVRWCTLYQDEWAWAWKVWGSVLKLNASLALSYRYLSCLSSQSMVVTTTVADQAAVSVLIKRASSPPVNDTSLRTRATD